MNRMLQKAKRRKKVPPKSLANLKSQVSREQRARIMDLVPQGADMNLRPIPKLEWNSTSDVKMRLPVLSPERIPYPAKIKRPEPPQTC